jgi:hypothetical protein
MRYDDNRVNDSTDQDWYSGQRSARDDSRERGRLPYRDDSIEFDATPLLDYVASTQQQMRQNLEKNLVPDDNQLKQYIERFVMKVEKGFLKDASSEVWEVWEKAFQIWDLRRNGPRYRLTVQALQASLADMCELFRQRCKAWWERG